MSDLANGMYFAFTALIRERVKFSILAKNKLVTVKFLIPIYTWRVKSKSDLLEKVGNLFSIGNGYYFTSQCFNFQHDDVLLSALSPELFPRNYFIIVI